MATTSRVFFSLLRDSAERILGINMEDVVLDVPDDMLTTLSEVQSGATVINKFKKIKPTWKVGDKIIITESDYIL